VAVVLALGLNLPFGIPNEWVWKKRADTSFDPVLAIAAIVSLIALCSFAWWANETGTTGQRTTGQQVKQNGKRIRLALVVTLLLAITFRIIIATLIPQSWRPVPVFWSLVILSPVATSFYDEAMSLEQQGLAHYLRHYHEQLPNKPFHAATHPPGLPMLFAVWRSLAMQPIMQRLVPMDENSLSLLRKVYIRIAPPMRPDSVYPSDEDLRASWWVATFCLLCGIAAMLIWAWFLWQIVPNPSGVALATTTPAMLWWQTTVDNIHLLAITATFAFAFSWQRVRTWAWAVLTGLAAGISLWLAFKNAVPIGCIALWLMWANLRSEKKLPAVQVVLALILAISPYLLSWLAFGFQPLETFKAASAAHHEQAGAHARSYLPWLFCNLADFGMALGGAWLGLVAAYLWVWWRQEKCQPSVSVVTLLVLLLLDLSGLVRGEVARLWMPFVPLLTFETIKHIPTKSHELALLTFIQGGIGLALHIQLEFLRPF
jgi:hypothetical protein